jgi:hypothetical protein
VTVDGQQKAMPAPFWRIPTTPNESLANMSLKWFHSSVYTTGDWKADAIGVGEFKTPAWVNNKAIKKGEPLLKYVKVEPKKEYTFIGDKTNATKRAGDGGKGKGSGKKAKKA